MTTFILVHGMFMGGWCWEPLARELQARGHKTLAPDLLGCGSDRTAPAQVTLQGWADQIAELAAGAGEPVVLVGHSRGGLVIGEAAETAPDQIALLVYVTALMLPNGRSAVELGGLLPDGMPAPALQPAPGPDGMSLVAPPGVRELLFSQCSPEAADWAHARIGPEPLMPLMTKARLTPDRWGRIPRVYIEALADRTVPISVQRAMIAANPPSQVVSIEADHMLILSHAAELADRLDEAARTCGRAVAPA